MADMYFNAKGATHSLRLRQYETNYADDRGLTDTEERLVETMTVWEGMVDGANYVYFEAPEDAEIWYLINQAVAAYVEYRDNYETERRER